MNKITIEEKAHFYDLVESSITVKLGYDELRISLERNLKLLSHRVEDYVEIDQRMFDVIEELEAELIDAKTSKRLCNTV
ncbi:hypothetical protein [Bathymodiolus japonicus methanotrophic gill symbiont]|uniref:hypothetical protein n=1 Tax=Bathymodiolus japonicus methanotrophic gill symbiont TaxID=113269 RepID=UPI001C8E15B3|nr:hypothetical protein [Bathymodiolus japonicus methanotrophic gill symbiont]